MNSNNINLNDYVDVYDGNCLIMKGIVIAKNYRYFLIASTNASLYQDFSRLNADTLLALDTFGYSKINNVERYIGSCYSFYSNQLKIKKTDANKICKKVNK